MIFRQSPGPMSSLEWTGTTVAPRRDDAGRRGSPAADDREPEPLQGSQHLPRRKGSEPGHDSDLDRLDTDERDARVCPALRAHVRANRLPNALAELIQGLGLGTATGQLGDGALVPAVLVLLDDDVVGACGHESRSISRLIALAPRGLNVLS